MVRRGNVSSPKFFKWHDITNLVNHKRFFGIECQNYELSEQFLLDEPDSAKYVWKMCKFTKYTVNNNMPSVNIANYQVIVTVGMRTYLTLDTADTS